MSLPVPVSKLRRIVASALPTSSALAGRSGLLLRHASIKTSSANGALGRARQLRRRLGRVRRKILNGRLSDERRLADDALVDDQAQRIEIAFGVDVAGRERLLGRPDRQADRRSGYRFLPLIVAESLCRSDHLDLSQGREGHHLPWRIAGRDGWRSLPLMKRCGSAPT